MTLAGDEARHLRDVLRLVRGAEAYVFDGAGREYRCAVEECTKARVALRVLEEVQAARPESTLDLELGVALLKGEKFELVVQKTTELGVSSIAPVITKQADVRWRDAADGARRRERWQRIALEAAKQSGRARVPRITAPRPFRSMIESSTDEGWRVMFTERAGQGLHEAVAKLDAPVRRIKALVGPEGGWADEELDAALGAGWTLVTLGGRTLRAETAALTATVLLQHLFGDLR